MSIAKQKKQLVPQLRFPEFDGKWKKNELGSIFKRSIKKNSELKVNKVLTNSATKGIVVQDDYFDREIANQNNLNGYYILKEDDFVYNPRISVTAPVGPVKRNKLRIGIISPLYTVLSPINKNPAHLDYMEMYFSSTLWHKYMRAIANYGARFDRMNIKNSDFEKLPIFLPIRFEEQQKIADFLSSIVTHIQALEKKKEALELYKKGVTQKIFKQEIRFKDDGKEFPEWEYKNGDKLFDSISDKNHNSDLPILAITQDQGAIPRHLIDYNIDVTKKSISSYKVVNNGDFIISLRSFQGGIEYSNYKGICSPAYIILRASKPINNIFYKYFFKTSVYITELNKKLEGIRDGKMVSYKYFSQIKLPYPSIPEQTKIANFLTSIDQQIEVISQQIQHTKSYKKGLLQQMFV